MKFTFTGDLCGLPITFFSELSFTEFALLFLSLLESGFPI